MCVYKFDEVPVQATDSNPMSHLSKNCWMVLFKFCHRAATGRCWIIPMVNSFVFSTFCVLFQGLYWALACIIQIYPNAKIPHLKGEPFTGKSNYEPLYTNYMPVEFVICGIVSGCLTIVNVICIFITAIIVLKIKEVAAPYTSSPDLRR